MAGNMSGTHKLSSGELAALVGGLMDLDTAENEFQDGEISYKPYKFGENNLSLMGDYYGLRMINERFCRLARTVFLPMLRLQPRISAFPPEVKSFADYSDEVENFVSLTTSRVEALRGSQMMVIPRDFVSMLTDAYYGGSIRNTPSNTRTEFTPTEQRVIELVSDGLNEAMALAWRDLMPITFDVQNREENLSFASFADAEDMVVNCSFMVQLPEADPANFDIIYPLQTLKPIAAQLRSRMHSDLLEEDLSWREKMERAVLNVPLNITAILAEPSVPLGRIGNVAPGEVVPVQMTPAPRLLVEGRPMFEADLGEASGKSALNLTRRIAD